MLLLVGEGGPPVPDQLKAFTTIKTSSETWEDLEEKRRRDLVPLSQYNVIILRDGREFDSGVWSHDKTLLVVKTGTYDIRDPWIKQGSFFRSRGDPVKFDVYAKWDVTVFKIDEEAAPESRENEYDLLNDYIIHKIIFPARFDIIEKQDINLRSANTLDDFIDSLKTRGIDISFLSNFYNKKDPEMLKMMKTFINMLHPKIKQYFPLFLETKKASTLGEEIVERDWVDGDPMRKHLAILLLGGYDNYKRSFYGLMEVNLGNLYRYYDTNHDTYFSKIFDVFENTKRLMMIRGNTFYPLKGLKGSARLSEVSSDAVIVRIKRFQREFIEGRYIDPFNALYLLSAQRLRYDESLYMFDGGPLNILFINDVPPIRRSTHERMIENYIHNIYSGLSLTTKDIGNRSISFLITTKNPWQILATLASCASLNNPRISCQHIDQTQPWFWFSEAYQQTSRVLYIAAHYVWYLMINEAAIIDYDYMKQAFEEIKTHETGVVDLLIRTYKTARENQ